MPFSISDTVAKDMTSLHQTVFVCLFIFLLCIISRIIVNKNSVELKAGRSISKLIPSRLMRGHLLKRAIPTYFVLPYSQTKTKMVASVSEGLRRKE